MARTEDFGADVGLVQRGGVWDLDPYFRLATGRRLLALALLRRFSTPRGALRRHPGYGEDLRQYVGSALTPHLRLAIAQRVAAQAEQDPRVLSAGARVTVDAATGTVQVDLRVQTAEGPFPLILTADRAAVRLREAA